MPLIELNKQKFFNNLDIVTQKTKSKDKIALVLKDNAYGHGLELMARLAHEYGITKAVIQTDAEAKRIEPFFPYILVLADIPNTPHPNIRYTINDINSLTSFPKNTKVELKVDTGMHRNGIDMSELEEAFGLIKRQGLTLEAVFTHHRSTDELTSEWFWQNENFEKIKKEATLLAMRHGFMPLRFHRDNSASLFRSRNFDESMARIGIAAYGCLELPTPFIRDTLQPVLSLYANKITTKKLKKSARIGYGGSGKTPQEGTPISTYDIGYGDGFFRALSHTYTTPEGVEIIGRISMDNTSFASDKERILVFNDARVPAKRLQTIPYEILTALKASIPRKVI